MNSKNIKRHLGNKLRDWMESIEDENVKAVVKENTIITGGALVSLLTGETVHDYDVYFRTKDACIAVAKYYVDKWNDMHKDKPVTLMWGEELAKDRHIIGVEYTITDTEAKTTADNHREVVPKS